LTQTKHPGQRQTPEKPTNPAVDKVNDIFADISEPRPEIAHSIELISRPEETTTQDNSMAARIGEPPRFACS
jgi:hypothetical protein